MLLSYSAHQVIGSTHLQPFTIAAMDLKTPFLQRFKGQSPYTRIHHQFLSPRPRGFFPFRDRRPIIPRMANMTEGRFDGPNKLNLDSTIDTLRKVCERFPQPVKSFPWIKALENFIQLIVDLVCAAIKYLSVPLLLVSSLSEMSYCAHERKLVLVPIPLLIGIAVAGVLRDTALELSPLLKEAEVPWHLIILAIFFTILKLPGPYYPYWGRILIPHIANGGLLRTLWCALMFYRRPEKASETTSQQLDDSHIESTNQ